MAEPAPARGAFFHAGLAARFQAAGVDGWLAPRLVAAQEDVARAFVPAGLVVVDGALEPMRARQIAMALARAEFVPHHHAPYPLHVAPRPQQGGILAGFMDWLARPSTARLHLGLVGLPQDRRLVQTQVQVSRMTEGERFPPHVDTDAPALACIYNFSQDIAAGDGGALRFGDGLGHAFAVEPRFNTACYFVSTGRLHEVTPLTKPGAQRYSATVFYVWAPP